jgi:hypothetical protein
MLELLEISISFFWFCVGECSWHVSNSIKILQIDFATHGELRQSARLDAYMSQGRSTCGSDDNL